MQTETKANVDQISGDNGAGITVLRFSGDISSTSHDALLGTYETVANPSLCCSISPRWSTSTPAALRW